MEIFKISFFIYGIFRESKDKVIYFLGKRLYYEKWYKVFLIKGYIGFKMLYVFVFSFFIEYRYCDIVYSVRYYVFFVI